ncbi:MAG: PH domain-containing protein [Bacteroidetes bacterium]|nr:PH domain-containing protein [Bacteroidota bacterium]
MLFQNEQISIAGLPQAEAVDFHKLSPSYRLVEVIATCLLFAFLLLGWVFFYLINPLKIAWLNWGLLSFWAVLFILSLVVALKRFAAEGYALREHDILHKHGVWWRSLTAIPFSRMQHCEISRGPVESAFGLATLKVYTAGGSGSDISISGLPMAEAQRVKEFVTRKIGDNERIENLEVD